MGAMDAARYRDCRLCPRECGVDRLGGQAGRCGETAELRIASIGAHFGEEPPISGTRGSGTVFFSGCSSGCFFCQNWQISLEHDGEALSTDEVERRVRRLVSAHRVHNLNFVTPDHFWPHVADLCRRLRASGMGIPFLFNSSGYQRPDMVAEYAASMDIFLPDFKFSEPELARICMGDAAYPRLALEALRRMVEWRGFLEPWDPSGAQPAERGVLVRHLVLPGQVANSLGVLELLRREFGRHLPLSLMSQFHPTPRCAAAGLLGRRVSAEEYAEVVDRAGELGFDQVLIQESPDGQAFFPDFRRRRPFAGNPPPIAGDGAATGDRAAEGIR